MRRPVHPLLPVSPWLSLVQIKTVSFFSDDVLALGSVPNRDASRLLPVGDRLPVQVFTTHLSRPIAIHDPDQDLILGYRIRDERAVMALFSPLVYRVIGPAAPPPVPFRIPYGPSRSNRARPG